MPYRAGTVRALRGDAAQQGFTAGQLSQLVFTGLAKLRGVGRPKLFRVKITVAGRKAIAE
jgi:hypothetical protein